MTDKPCNEIVIDAANLIHDDRGIEEYDENGDTIPQMIPERLLSAVEENQRKGYKVTALLKAGTYKYGMKRFKANEPSYANFGIISRLKESGIVHLINSKDDDLYILEHALKQNALILSRDWFNDHRESKPDFDWERVDTLRINDYDFIENTFRCPKINDISSVKQKGNDEDSIGQIKALIEAQTKEISLLRERVHMLEERDFSQEIATMTKEEMDLATEQVRKDSARGKSPEQCANVYLKMAKEKSFCRPKKKAALKNDLKSRGLASKMGTGAVVNCLQGLKAIHLNKNSVKWRI